MNEEQVIKLGPLLGIEGEYDYSVIFLSLQDLEIKDIILRLSIGGKEQNVTCENKQKLHKTFRYKFAFTLKKADESHRVAYSIHNKQQKIKNNNNADNWEFIVPGITTIPKVGYASCNGTNKKMPEQLTDKDYVMWERMLQAHLKEDLKYSFHCLVLGGDQVYADPIWDYVTYFKKNKLLGRKSSLKIAAHKIDDNDLDSLANKIEEFYEKLYIDSWSRKAVSNVMSSIPTIMMWDDHDIFDGWGSHSKELQESPIFQLIFKVAKKYFTLLQIRTTNNNFVRFDDQFLLRLSFRNYEIITLDNRSHRSMQEIMI